jgi:hypothetical protein
MVSCCCVVLVSFLNKTKQKNKKQKKNQKKPKIYRSFESRSDRSTVHKVSYFVSSFIFF